MIKLIIAILSMSVFTDGSTINLFEGIDEIKLNESRFNHVKKMNPDFKYSKHFQKHEILPILLGHFSKNMYSKEKGITVYFKKRWVLGNYYPNKICLDASYTGKSTSGIGIGSSFDTIIGLIDTTSKCRLDVESPSFLQFTMKIAKYRSIVLTFHGKETNDTTRVRYIEMEYRDLR